MEENKQSTSIWKSKLLAIKNMVIENVIGGAGGNTSAGSGPDKKHSKENQVTPMAEVAVKNKAKGVGHLGWRMQAVEPVQEDIEDLESGGRMVAQIASQRISNP